MVLEWCEAVGLGRVPGVACFSEQYEIGETPGRDLGAHGGVVVFVWSPAVYKDGGEACTGQCEQGQGVDGWARPIDRSAVV